MLKLSDMQEKEVINVLNGERLGYIYDFEIDLDKGTIVGMILPSENKVVSFFSKSTDIFIGWSNIIKIGTDIILVNLQNE
ncbi:MAG: YlmC/YmxH family sporulation protein [Tissierellia bacterium]|nr:YlmC/YmxH family sporulation protein [Tissierellia bacterium]MDD4725584.1 YlmC/YmxH family sporulation protein [Tissierellia bacterium]